MALNFPANTSNPYIDPSSGLKYIFNNSVGAWEAAVQPPAIVATSTPQLNIAGFLFFNDLDKKLYVNRDGTPTGWIQSIPTAAFPVISSGGNTPPNPVLNQLWFDADRTKRLYIAYQPTGGVIKFIDASPSGLNAGKPASAVGTVPPSTPEPGALWWNTVDGNLYIWFVDQDGGSAWVIANTTAFGANSGIVKISAVLPVRATGNSQNVQISVDNGTEAIPGVSKIATQAVTDAGTDDSDHITAKKLRAAISNQVPLATSSVAGKIQLATQAEVTAGTDGSKAVTPLTLRTNLTTLGYDNIPAGSIVMWPNSKVPAGWLECNGQSTAIYAELAKVVGPNVPDLRGMFVRGWSNDRIDLDGGRRIKSEQTGINKTHSHKVTDNGHKHPLLDDGHTHGVSDPGHGHTYSAAYETGATAGGSNWRPAESRILTTPNAKTGISLSNTRAGIQMSEAGSNIDIDEQGNDDGPRPRNIALMYIIKT